MAATTYNNAGNNLTPLRMCDIDGSGDVLNGFDNFGDETKTLLDWSYVNTANGSIDVNTTTAGKLTIQADPATFGTGNTPIAPGLIIDTSFSDDFDFYTEFTHDVADVAQRTFNLCYYVDSTNYIGAIFGKSTGNLVRGYKHIDDVFSWIGDGTTAVDMTGLCALRIVRSGNNWSLYYKDVGSTGWETLATAHTQAFTGAGKILLCAQTRDTSYTAVVDKVVFTSGSPVGAEFRINDSGVDYMDAGAGGAWDGATFTASTTGTIRSKFVDSATTTFGAFSAYASWPTSGIAGNYPHANSDLRYRQQGIELTGDAATFTSLTADVYDADVNPPTAPGDVLAYYDSDLVGTIDAAIKFTHGTDAEGNYDGVNIGYLDSADGLYYYQQSGGNFATTESYASLLINSAAEGSEGLEWAQNIPNTATHIRLTAWDTAGNHSARTDAGLIEISGDIQADPATALTITDSGDGCTWTVTTTTTETNPAVFLYNQSDDSLVAVVDASAATGDLTAGQSLYCKIIAAGKTMSDRYPAASGVSVPALAPVDVPTQPTLAVADDEDGTGATATVTGADTGTTNTIYTADYGTTTWTSAGTITGNGTLALTVDTPGLYWAYANSANASGSSASNPVIFAATDSNSSTYWLAMEAVAGHLQSLAWTDDDGTAFTASVDMPPDFDNVSTPTMKVFTDVDEIEASNTGANEAVYRVNVAVVRRSKDDDNQTERLMAIRQKLQDVFVGSRLPGMTSLYCVRATAPVAVNESEFLERHNFIGVIMLEIEHLRARLT